MKEKLGIASALLTTPAHMMPEKALLFLSQVLGEKNTPVDYSKTPEFIKNFVDERIRIFSRKNANDFVLNSSENKNLSSPQIPVLYVKGTILKDSYWYYGVLGTKFLAQKVEEYAKLPLVKGIVLHIDSGGGQALATDVLKNAIVKAKKAKKKVIAFVEDLCASAAYDIASVCNEIWVNNKLARIGSIGTFLPLQDVRGMYEKYGIVLHEIYATKSTDKNKDYLKALNSDYSDILKNYIDPFNEHFLTSVQKNRPRLNKEKTLTGKLFFYDEAKKYGLVDALGTLENCLQSFFTNSKKSTVSKQKSETDFDKNTSKILFENSIKTSKNMATLSERFKNIFSALGFVPNENQPLEKADLYELERQMSDLGQKSNDLSKENEVLTTDLEAVRASYKNDKASWEKEKSEFESKITDLTQNLADKSEELQNQKNAFATLKNQFDHNSKLIQTYGTSPAEEPTNPTSLNKETKYEYEFLDPNRSYD